MKKLQYVFCIITLNIISYVIISLFESITGKYSFWRTIMSIDFNYGYIAFYSCVNILFLLIIFRYLKNKQDTSNNVEKLTTSEPEEPEKSEEPEQHEVRSVCMTNCGERVENGKRCFTWQLVAKLYINTTERLTILFNKCSVELSHEQYKDIHSNFNDVMLVKKEYANNEVCVFDKFVELQKCQISNQVVIDTPSTITLLAMGETSVWTPGDKESIALMFNLPVSERDYKPIQIKISVSKIFRNDGEIEFR